MGACPVVPAAIVVVVSASVAVLVLMLVDLVNKAMTVGRALVPVLVSIMTGVVSVRACVLIASTSRVIVVFVLGFAVLSKCGGPITFPSFTGSLFSFASSVQVYCTCGIAVRLVAFVFGYVSLGDCSAAAGSAMRIVANSRGGGVA